MTCKDCLHFDVCDYWSSIDLNLAEYYKNCYYFKCKPCLNIGDKVYQIDGVRIYSSEIQEITYTARKVIFVTDSIVFDERAIHNTIFLTREEAEQKLKERDKG